MEERRLAAHAWRNHKLYGFLFDPSDKNKHIFIMEMITNYDNKVPLSRPPARLAILRSDTGKRTGRAYYTMKMPVFRSEYKY